MGDLCQVHCNHFSMMCWVILEITSLQKYCKLLRLRLRLCFRNTQGRDRGSLKTTGPGCEMFHQDLKTVWLPFTIEVSQLPFILPKLSFMQNYIMKVINILPSTRQSLALWPVSRTELSSKNKMQVTV